MAGGQVERLAPDMAAEIRRFAAALAMCGYFEVDHVTARLALKLISVALFGHQILTAADEDVMVQAVQSVEDEVSGDMLRILPPTPWAARARRRRQTFARNARGLMVQRTRARAPESSVFRSLEKLGLNDAEFRDAIMTMLTAGHYTTGTASAWVLYYLATEPGLSIAIAREAERVSTRDGELSTDRLKEPTVSQAVDGLWLRHEAWLRCRRQ
jgi:cytochrome P450